MAYVIYRKEGNTNRGSTDGWLGSCWDVTLYTKHLNCKSIAHAHYVMRLFHILNTCFVVTGAVTVLYLREALYLAGKKVFTVSTQEQRTRV